MKRLALSVLLVLGAISAFARYDDSTPNVLDHTYLCVSLLPPWQIPIPWDKYDTYDPSWGGKDVTGLAVDLTYGENASVAGLGLGIVTRCQKLWGVQLGLVPIVEKGCGVQIGLVNWAEDLAGVQIGLVNIISNSPLTVFPIVNMCF